jgi:hypothetical protein
LLAGRHGNAILQDRPGFRAQSSWELQGHEPGEARHGNAILQDRPGFERRSKKPAST